MLARVLVLVRAVLALDGEVLASRAERLSPRARRGLAVVASGLFHLALVLALLWNAAGRSIGLPETTSGGGQMAALNGDTSNLTNVVVTHMKTLGRVLVVQTPASQAGAAATAFKTRSTLLDSELAVQQQADPGQASGTSHEPGRAASESHEPAAMSAAANGPPTAPARAQGGDPDGDENILRQIARCLPPGKLPNLKFAHLHIELGADGTLRAAPTMQADLPTGYGDAVREADSVVQAALQCGPYQTRTGAQMSYALVPDFSFLDTAQRTLKP